MIRVRDTSNDASQLLAEVPVGKSRVVALSPDDKRAYVTNAADGHRMSVIDLTSATPQIVGAPVPVGLEPRGIAITPNGTFAFIANHTVGKSRSSYSCRHSPSCARSRQVATPVCHH